MMLACRSGTRCLASRAFFFSTSSARSTSASTFAGPATTTSPGPADKSQDSIFTAPESPWDHVFSDIEPAPPPAAQRLRTRLNDSATTSHSGHQKTHGQPNPNPSQSLVQRASAVKRQRASMTAREMSVFDDIFDLIFSEVSAKEGKSSPSPSSATSTSAPSPSTPSIGCASTGAPLNDLFRTLRRRASRVRWTSAIDEELDRKKETMELFNTDYDLLQWVTSELFGGAVAASSSSSSTTPSRTPSNGEPPSKPTIYPHLIAHAMRLFRTTYANPSLSLAVFNHAAHASIPSYVFGCTAPAYNELIEAKWEGWGDLKGVCSALEEMRANGVKMDGRTRVVVEKVRREVGEARPIDLGTDGGVNLLARRVWGVLGEAEVVRLLHRIEQLALRDRSRKSRSSPHEESWKGAVLQPAEDDGWCFDGWDTKKQRRKARSTAEDETRSRPLDDWTVLGTEEEETAFR